MALDDLASWADIQVKNPVKDRRSRWKVFGHQRVGRLLGLGGGLSFVLFFSAQAQPYHLWQNQRKLGPDRCHFNPTCSIQNQLRKKNTFDPSFNLWIHMVPKICFLGLYASIWPAKQCKSRGVGWGWWGDGGAIVWPDLAANLLCAIATIPRFIAPRANPFFSDFFSRLKGFWLHFDSEQ